MTEATREAPTPTLGTSLVGTESVRSHKGAKFLVMVPGHAIYVGREASHAKLDEYWMGGFRGEAPFYTQHAIAGVAEIILGGRSILVFSGGQTREAAGPLSEAQSYWSLADQHAWLKKDGVKERAFTEEFARDSLENLAFSVGRFVQITGERPVDIIICGWTFKEARYRLHADALGIRQGNLHYIGVNNLMGDALAGALKGEAKTLADFRASPLGTEGILAQKRAQRDPFLRGDAYGYYNVSELFGLLRQGQKSPLR